MLTKDQLLEQDERYKYLSEFGEEVFSNQNHHEILVILPQIPTTPIYYRSNQFRRGNPTLINIIDKKLEQIPLIEGEENAKKLILKQNNITKIENLVSLPQLEEIDLSDNQVKKIECFENVVNLSVIKLNSNKIKKIENLSLMQNLRVLHLRNNKIENLSNLSTLKNLEELDVSQNRIEQIEVKKLVPKLEILNISQNQLANLKGFEHFVILKNLNIKDNDFDEQQDLLSLNSLEKLKDLTIEEDEQDLIDFLAVNLQHVKFINGNSIKKLKKKVKQDPSQQINNNHTQINLSSQNSKLHSDKTFSQQQSLNSDIDNSDKFYDINQSINKTQSVRDSRSPNINQMHQTSDDFQILQNQNFQKDIDEDEQKDMSFEKPKSEEKEEQEQINDDEDIQKQVDQDLEQAKAQSDKTLSQEEELEQKEQLQENKSDNESNQQKDTKQEDVDNKNNVQDHKIKEQTQEQEPNQFLQINMKPWELSLRDRTDDNIILQFFEKLVQETQAKKAQKKSKSFLFLGNKQYPIGYVQKQTPKSIRVVGDGFYEFFEEIQQYQQIEQLTFECVLVDNLIIKSNRIQLDKLKKLKTLKFVQNNIKEYLELINFENIPNLTHLYIEKNEVMECDMLKYFIYYRYSKIEVFNDNVKTEEELEKTKEIYLDFDKTLQKLHKINLKKFKLQNSDKQKISKKIAESFIQNIQNRYFSEKNFDLLFDNVVQTYLESIIDS